ncbi:benzoate 4-monooxygenase cytochrome P450 [Trichodelitschia bisporula]|uniref:Benzoate 4-monooxygenase cytochrome P450 n=1 Tax=Trichodelitschia bisporula TaxID=703511 RepID=A0A6G1HTD5_9PEZI|nr:benzoate 4-monooxygenase cytochrome P450 [Trichodelitschia bisporula]
MAIDLPLPLPALLALAFGFYVLTRRIAAYSRLSHIPGPRWHAWSRLPLAWTYLSPTQHLEIYGLHRKYGPLVRLGPNMVLCSDARVSAMMNAPGSKYIRSDWFSTFKLKPRCDNIFSVRDEKKHSDLRRKMGLGYAGKEVPGLEGRIDVHVQNWVEMVRRKYVVGKEGVRPAMDLAQQAQFFTLDVISDLAFNAPFGDIPAEEDKFAYVKVSQEAMSSINMLGIFPHVYRWIEQSRLIDLIAPSSKDKTGMGPIVGIAKEQVAKRFENPELRNEMDMLGSFLRHGLSQEEAESETVLQILAGSDTAATAIRTIFLYLLTNPRILNTLRAEIDNAVREGKCSAPVTDVEARAMPYLQGVIKEGLRLHPPVVGLALKIVPPGGDTVCGKFLPGGTKLGPCWWAFGRNEEVFGPDIEVFRPERWIEAAAAGDPEKLTLMERAVDSIFSSGRFKCLGITVALVELNKVFVEMVRRFEMEVVDPLRPMESICNSVFLQHKFWVRVMEREM